MTLRSPTSTLSICPGFKRRFRKTDSLYGSRRDFPSSPKNLSVALAYFGLESKRSRDRGQENGSSVSLEEVSRPLKLFAQALTGRSLGLRSLQEPERGFCHPFGLLPCTDGETIFLPEVMRNFSTPNLNFLAFKLATAHQAGYVEFGTFAFRLSSIQDSFPPEYIRACLRGISEKGKEISPLEAFFHLFPAKRIWPKIFSVSSKGREWIIVCGENTGD